MTDPPDIIHATDDGRWFSRLAERSRTSTHAYRLIVAAERSAASHRQYMAAVGEAWSNLPEYLADEFPTPDDLRKWALIRTGFCDIQKVTGNKLLRFNGYSVVTTDADGVTTVRTARSQSFASMGKKEFEASKTAVLDYLASLIKTTPDELMKAGKAA
jgi:hypothetical protein